MSDSRSIPGDAHLKELGLGRWRHRGGNGTDGAGNGTKEASDLEASGISEDAEGEKARPTTLTLDAEGRQLRQWRVVRKEVSECVLCELHRTRKNTVFGVGSEDADLMLIGEAPGADEDAQGEPFVGRAGKLLDSMLEAIGMSREQVFIANILKCRPPNNENPTPEQAGECRPYLDRQIELIQPRVILALGAVAAHNLLGVETPIGRLRGTVHEMSESGIPVIPTYHPAYLLRRPQGKAQALEDLLLLCDVLGDAGAAIAPTREIVKSERKTAP